MHSMYHTYYAVAIVIFMVVYVLTTQTKLLSLLLMGLMKSTVHVFEHCMFHSSLHNVSKCGYVLLSKNMHRRSYNARTFKHICNYSINISTIFPPATCDYTTYLHIHTVVSKKVNVPYSKLRRTMVRKLY